MSKPTIRRPSSTTTSVPTPVRCIVLAASVSAASGLNRVRVGDDAVLAPLHALDFADLWLDVTRAKAAIDDADPAFLGNGDRHLRARDGVHIGRHDRPPQPQAGGQLARQVDGCGIAPFDDAVLGCEEKVVERAAANELE